MKIKTNLKAFFLKKTLFLSGVALFLLLLLFSPNFLSAKVGATEVEDLEKKIAEYQNEISQLQKQVSSLSQQISLMDSQIKLTTLKISQSEKQIRELEKEIVSLTGKISQLDGSLDYLSRVLLERIKETYKSKKFDPLVLFFSSKNFSEFVSHYRYLQVIQMHDRELLLSMEETRTSYDEQKQLKEEKQDELEILKVKLGSQKVQLDLQIAERKNLLQETKGKEANYQKLLAEARAELQAILGILAGEGKEEEAGHVNQGDRIASVISGASCNSSGTHLHFMVSQGGNTFNPFSYLRGGIDYENCSASSCAGGGDAFNPSGSWDWPLNPKIILSQGYGYTWAIQNTWVGRIYSFHNGIDIKGSSLEVKAVKSGTLFRGGYVGKNCTLRYVRVRHEEGGLDTYYLHVNF